MRQNSQTSAENGLLGQKFAFFALFFSFFEDFRYFPRAISNSPKITLAQNRRFPLFCAIFGAISQKFELTSKADCASKDYPGSEGQLLIYFGFVFVVLKVVLNSIEVENVQPVTA